MEIYPRQGNIFDLIIDQTCDSIIIFGSNNNSWIGTDWKIFREKFSVLQEQIEFHSIPWVKHHSEPIYLKVNNISKYIYFLKNDLREDSLSDSRLVLQLISAIKLLVSLGNKSFAINGARPLSFLPGALNDPEHIKLKKKCHNDNVYAERVALIIDLLHSMHVQLSCELTFHLISRNDVFIKNIKQPIIYKSGKTQN